MSSILSFLKAFSISGIVLGALYILVPEDKFRKPLVFVLCLCFVSIIIFSLPKNIQFDYHKGELISDVDINDLNEQTAIITIKRALAIAGISYSDLEVLFTKDNSGNIVYIDVTIYTNEPASKIEEALKSENIRVSVINE